MNQNQISIAFARLLKEHNFLKKCLDKMIDYESERFKENNEQN